MGIFDFFKKEEKLDKEVIKLFEKIHGRLTAKQIVNQAISYRNLGQYDKSIQLLQVAINKYNHFPAKTILGVTLALKGDIEAAEQHFLKTIAEHIKRNDYPLIEVYANLGLLHYNHRNDIESALKWYKAALNASRPKDAGIDDKGYEVMLSAVFRDLCVIYFERQDFQLAKEYATKRLQTERDCPEASRVYGCCLFYEMLQTGVNLSKDTKDADIESIVKHLQSAIENNPCDYASIAYCAAVLFIMRQMIFYKSNQILVKSIESKENEYIEQLKKHFNHGEETAKRAYKIYQVITNIILSDVEDYNKHLEFNPQLFLSFIRQKSSEKEINNCPNCGEPDILFASGRGCSECGASLPKINKNKVDSLQFALEILKEFVQKYDECIPLEYKHTILTFLSGLISTCLIQNALPLRQELVKLQRFNDMTFGGPRLGATISVKKNKPVQIAFSKELAEKQPNHRKAFAKSISAITTALQFLLEIGDSAEINGTIL